MTTSNLPSDLIKNIKGQDCVCVLPGEYFSPQQYIQNLIDQLEGDIYPLLKTHATFTVARNTFCFIDHVSSLKLGPNYNNNQTDRIEAILKEFAGFNPYINSKYNKYAQYVVQVYRHDIVHNIRPFPHQIRIVDKNGASNKTSWFILSQEGPQNLTFEQASSYFQNVNNRKNLCHLRYYGDQVFVNNWCLFFDLVNFLHEYKKELDTDNSAQGNFVDNYKKILDKNYNKIADFELDKTADKECVFL